VSWDTGPSNNTYDAITAGIVAYASNVTITNSYNGGQVTGLGATGGIVGSRTTGDNVSASPAFTIMNCYNAAPISDATPASAQSPGAESAGAIAGRTLQGSFTNNYWRYYDGLLATGIYRYGGSTTPDDVNNQSLTPPELANPAAVTNLNTDPAAPAFKEGNNFPVLVWQSEELGAPVITTQLVSSYAKLNTTGSALTVSARVPEGSKAPAEGRITSFEWYKNTPASTTGDTLVKTDDNSGQGFPAGHEPQTSSYTPATDALDDSYYYCVITNSWGPPTGTETTTSAVVRFVVVDDSTAPAVPQISTQPQALELEQHSTGATLSVACDPAPANGTLSYQWFSNEEESNEGGTPVAAPSSTPDFALPTATPQTLYYYCVITNTATDGSGVTQTATSDPAAVLVHGVRVYTALDLYNIAQLVNETDEDLYQGYEGYTIELMNDIDLSATPATRNWTPIGTGRYTGGAFCYFRGTFDGQGHTISGLSMTSNPSGASYVGLFGYASGAAIKNLVVEGSIDLTDSGSFSSVGGVVGYASGTTIENVGSRVDVAVASASTSIGGIVGQTSSVIKNSYYQGDLRGACTRIGGIAAYASGSSTSLENVYAQGSLTYTGSYTVTVYLGGICGSIATGRPLNNAYSTMTIAGEDGSLLAEDTPYTNVRFGGITTSTNNLIERAWYKADFAGAAIPTPPPTNFYDRGTPISDEGLKSTAIVSNPVGNSDDLNDLAEGIEPSETPAFVYNPGGYPRLSWELTRAGANTEALEAAIETASTAIVEAPQVSVDGTDVPEGTIWITQEAIDALQAAIEAVRQIPADVDAHQAEADAALAALEEALAAFEAAKAPGTLAPPPPPPPTPPANESWKRLSGDDRYDTMAAIVSEAFTAGDTDAVIVATGENFPDALAASGLAGIADAPVILTEGGALSEQAKATIEALEPTTVYIAGGTGSVSSAVEDALKGLVDDPSQVIRASGDNRYLTALDIYAKGKEAGVWGSTAIIASGDNYADALSVSPYSFAEKAPIFLADPVAGLDAMTVEILSGALESGEITRVIIAGGAGSVPDVVKIQLGYLAGDYATFTRLYGTDRYGTSVAVARYAAANSASLGFHQIAAATGENFPDALAGGAFAGRIGTVLLLVSDDAAGRIGIDMVVGTNATAIGFGHVLGGVGTVSPALQSALETASSAS
jgi:putative cell wall-binding protein